MHVSNSSKGGRFLRPSVSRSAGNRTGLTSASGRCGRSRQQFGYAYFASDLTIEHNLDGLLRRERGPLHVIVRLRLGVHDQPSRGKIDHPIEGNTSGGVDSL